jgi:DDE superfamily endonuclease
MAKGRFATAIDTRLYLPKEWTEDAERCHKAGIPENEPVFKTKSQLALEIVQAPRQWSALWLGWGRCGIRSDPEFLFALADASCTFLINVHKSFVIYQVDPQPTIAQPTSKGRKATRSVSGQKSLSVESS